MMHDGLKCINPPPGPTDIRCGPSVLRPCPRRDGPPLPVHSCSSLPCLLTCFLGRCCPARHPVQKSQGSKGMEATHDAGEEGLDPCGQCISHSLRSISSHALTVALQCLGDLPHDPKFQPSFPLNVTLIPPVNNASSFYDGLFRLDVSSVPPGSSSISQISYTPTWT